jgi:hypothetical protein
MMQALHAKITFEHVDPQDLIDVARSVSGHESEGIFVGAPGSGVDRLLAWSLADLQLAVDASGGAARERCAANALVNGRRALACLVDWYLTRDCFSLCKDTPLPEKKQAELLLECRLIDDLSSRVLGRAIQTRNVVEHEYSAPTLEVAEDVVELLRRTIQCLRAESDPAQGPSSTGGASQAFFFVRLTCAHGWVQSCHRRPMRHWSVAPSLMKYLQSCYWKSSRCWRITLAELEAPCLKTFGGFWLLSAG